MHAACSLYLIRHGIAADATEQHPDDAARPLTDQGVERLCAQFRALRGLDVELDHILSSPLLRAVQTAALLAETFRNKPRTGVIDALKPGGRYDAVMAELARLPQAGGVALVGHEPSIGMLAAGLIGSRVPIPFKKGGVCRIDVESLPPSQPGQMQWFLPPKILRGLAG